MDVETIKAIGQFIVLPLCCVAALWLFFDYLKD